MKIDTMIRKTTSARIAFSVISRPHVELVNEKLTSCSATPAASAKSAVTVARLVAWNLLDLHRHHVGRLRASQLDSGARRRDLVVGEHLFGLGDTEGLAGRDVPRVAALEVEAEVQALVEERDHGDDNDDHGAVEPDPPVPVEVDGRLPAREPAET